MSRPRLEELLAKATPGPWEVYEPNCPAECHSLGIVGAEPNDWTLADVNRDFPSGSEQAKATDCEDKRCPECESVRCRCEALDRYRDWEAGQVIAAARMRDEMRS